MTFGSLFSGIGGIDLGFERAGMRVAWQCEKDEFCRRVLAKHWPGVKCYEDVREVGSDAARVDVIAGGFPCQPHSLAGKRKGAGDDRDLWPEFRRVVAEFKPDWVVGENVPGIYGPFLDGVLADLESLDYRALVFEIPACAVDAPHRRARVFVVAHSGSQRRQQDAGSASTDEGEDAGRASQRDHVTSGDGEAVGLADSDRVRPQDERWPATGRRDADGRSEHGDMGDSSRALHDRGGESGQRRRRQSTNASAWGDAEWLAFGDGKARRVKPGVRLLAHGIPARVARLRALGNSVVPQVAEVIGRMIVAADGVYCIQDQ